MLRHLSINNFALVERLELDLAPGMTVLTGETGAGKSILLDALGLVLGDRADSNSVRSGCDRAEISAIFDISTLPRAQAWLKDRELEQGDECIVRRTLSADGGSRGYINGQPNPAQSLRELGEQLVDIHGQHAHQSLLKRDVQRELLDSYAGHEKWLEQTRSHYRHWHALQRDLDQLIHAAGERDFRLELLRYQVRELETLALRPGELAALEDEHARLANASRLQESAQHVLEQLYEGDEIAITSRLGRLLSELHELQTIDNRLQVICELLDTAVIQTTEAAGELRHYLNQDSLDPARLQSVEQRLAAILDLARKHRCNADELPELFENLQQELQALEQQGQRLDGLEEGIKQARKMYREQANKLSASRQQAARTLSSQVSANMAELGMKNGRFQVALEKLPADEGGMHGLERVEFRVSANPGQNLKPLAKVASGGELSRISLAIQMIGAGRSRIPTLIFDEVDVGVGGGVAEMVGRQLRNLGADRQVLCVTHQAQVAAQGHQHLQVSKKSSQGTTHTAVKLLNQDARIEEIARMIGGMHITEQTRSHAREMLALAQAKTQPASRRNNATP